MADKTITRQRAALLTAELNAISNRVDTAFMHGWLGALLADYPEIWVRAVEGARVAQTTCGLDIGMAEAQALMCRHERTEPVHRPYEEEPAGHLCAECGWLLPPEWLAPGLRPRLSAELVSRHRGHYHESEPGDRIVIDGTHYTLMAYDKVSDSWYVDKIGTHGGTS